MTIRNLPIDEKVYGKIPAALKLAAWHIREKDALAFERYLNSEYLEIMLAANMLWFQDYTGIPEIRNLASKRDALAAMGSDPRLIKPAIPVHLVFDHSVRTKGSLSQNRADEFAQNLGRIRIGKWAGEKLGIKIIPPNKGVIHQINTEYLVPVFNEDGTPVFGKGTDSHTPMVNANCILAWGIGGAEAQKVYAGEAIGMTMPEVVAINLTGVLSTGVNSSDLALALKPILRKIGVKGQFVQFIGKGVDSLPLEARATIANVAAEFGSRVALFMIDKQTIKFLSYSGRDKGVEERAKAYGLWRNHENEFNVQYSRMEEIDLSLIETGISGPNTPHNWVSLNGVTKRLQETFNSENVKDELFLVNGSKVPNGALLLASIASCTHTANPDSVITAALLAKKAYEKGLIPKPWTKTAFASGSRIAYEYLKELGLDTYLEKMGFGITAFGCGACIGQSGGLNEMGNRLLDLGLTPTSVVSANRNYAGRQDANVSISFLANPHLVIAYSIAGRIDIDIRSYDLGNGTFLKDIMPSLEEIAEAKSVINKDMHTKAYANLFEGTDEYNEIEVPNSEVYDWPEDILVKPSPFFEGMTVDPQPLEAITGARTLGVFGDDFSTDAISPAGDPVDIPAAMEYLAENGITDPSKIPSIGGFRSNWEMLASTIFSNPTNQNLMVERKGGYTIDYTTGNEATIFKAANNYRENNIPLVVIGGENYGCGSSRVMAASGPKMLGVKSVIATSYEAIHRSNLWQLGILPLTFKKGDTPVSLALSGSEQWTIPLDTLTQETTSLMASYTRGDETHEIELIVAIESPQEFEFLRHGGAMQQQLREA